MATTEELKYVARDFGIRAPLTLLPGGERRTYRGGEAVFRKESDPIDAAYIAEVYADLREDGFRVPRPIARRTGDGSLGADGAHGHLSKARPPEPRICLK